MMATLKLTKRLDEILKINDFDNIFKSIEDYIYYFNYERLQYLITIQEGEMNYIK